MRIAEGRFAGVDMGEAEGLRSGFPDATMLPVCGYAEANAKMEELADILMKKVLLYGIVTVLLILVCVVCVLLIRRRRRMRRNSAASAVQQSVNVEEITLDLTEQTEELRAYADEVHTLVDIGYFSETEVIE